ncbi:PAS domain-containing protein [Dictyobacter aurantiacus]|uniref:histidine kinase n=1 Tax=Dictyobacter aurantiacus TaxID=1936993 RepID=A0A401ZJH9_9CHLR|nr:PAS domain-containing protein [Dictyobacter aurantiacus]GCE07017.1 hypothetical protein KDAU_43460 [Dictyobacter aurantiacus]
MDPEYGTQLEYTLDTLSVGVALLDGSDFRIRYVNPYLRSLLVALLRQQEVVGRSASELLPETINAALLPLLRQVASGGERVELAEVPFEGFLEIRGRTYWRITIESYTATDKPGQAGAPGNGVAFGSKPGQTRHLRVMLEDITEAVRARLHIQAVHAISSALAGPASLPLVLERILNVLQETFGSKRCAIILRDNSVPAIEPRLADLEESQLEKSDGPQTARVVAQLGLHAVSQHWQARIDENILLATVAREHRTRIITNTSTAPHYVFPYLNHQGEPHRPGSVLCVPIFEPHADDPLTPGQVENAERVVFGTIEVYHLRARGFPAEEVALLEQFAQQAALAIQNARVFRRVDRLARTASRTVRQKDNIMQAMPDGVIIFDPRWRIADVNQAARDLLGWSENVVGQSLQEAFGRDRVNWLQIPWHPEHVIKDLEQRALSGTTDEVKLTSANGRAYTLQISYTPIRDELGDIFAFIVIYHDITEQVADRERIEAEVVMRTAELNQRNQALQEAQEAQAITSARMQVLLERLPSGVILVAAENKHISVINRQAVELLLRLGAPLPPAEDLDEALQRTLNQDCERLLRALPLLGPSGTLVPYDEQPLAIALLQGESSEAELHLQTNDGQALYLLVNAAPLRALDGGIESAILVLQDISRVKLLERVREDFFTTMAHELKTPLANIRAHLSALLAPDLHWTPEAQLDYLQTADQQVDRLVGMINHFLDASRVEAGALRLAREPILLPEMIEDLRERLEALINAASSGLQIQLPEQVPAVYGDYELIVSVLTNLLSNAFRYAPEGDPVQLLVEPIQKGSRQRAQYVKISVVDHGPGISQEQQSALFTRFSTFAASNRPSADRPGQPEVARRQKATRWSPATGLGLYISRGIIEAHDSQLEVSSSPGCGATFAFTLPVFKERRRPARNTTPPTTALANGE